MGAPVLAFSLAGYFNYVVATDTDLEIYSNAISFLESHASVTLDNPFNAVVIATHKNTAYKKNSYVAEKPSRKIKEVVYSEVVHDISDDDSKSSASSRKRHAINTCNEDQHSDSDTSDYTPSSDSSTSSTSSDDDEDSD